MNETVRIKEVFDNWYYKGFSNTIGKYGLGDYTKSEIFNEFLKWSTFFEILKYTKPYLPEYSILDAGCGNGNALRRLIEYGADPAKCFGVDISTDAIEFAKKQSPEAVNLQQGFIDQLEFEDEKFDLVFCLGVLIHILDDEYIRKISREFYRVCKKDAIVIILVSDADLAHNWGEDIAHTTRDFSVSQKELQSLFPDFECLGFFDSHNDAYNERDTQPQILHKLQSNRFNADFKTFVFRPKL